jgi:hypothetical protein
MKKDKLRNVTRTEWTPEQEDKILADGISEEALMILKSTFYDQPAFRPSDPQPHTTVYRAGQRDVVGFIMEAIDRINFPQKEEDVPKPKRTKKGAKA